MNRTFIKQVPTALMLASSALALGCGSDGGTGNDSQARATAGKLSAPWSSYCVATFDSDYDVIDVFDDLLFTAKAGSQYLLGDLDGPFGIELLAPTDEGPVDFEIEPVDGQPLPFSTNCSAGMTKSYLGVFADVTIYEDRALTKSLCALKAGTVVENDGGGFGYSLESEITEENSVYAVSIGALASECGGNAEGFIEVGQTEVFGWSTTLVPLSSFIGPL